VAVSDAYLLVWNSPASEPEFFPVKITALSHTTDAGPWVTFTFLGGAQHGQQSGAPCVHIISEKEKNIINAASDDIFLKKEQVRQINAAVRDTYRMITAKLAAHTRDLAHLKESP
jgi:hypothetical protein